MASYLRHVLLTPKRQLATAAVSLLAWAPALVFLSDNTYQIGHIKGPSMIPLFNTPHRESSSSTGLSTSNPRSRDTVLISMHNPASNLRRGDVIAFWTPHNAEKTAVKRIVAIAGDQVETRPPYPFRKETVPTGHVWVEGDNVEGRFSRDSNAYGPIPKALITGKVVARVWPSPMWMRPEDWEEKERRRKNNRVRRDIGMDVEEEIFRR